MSEEGPTPLRRAAIRALLVGVPLAIGCPATGYAYWGMPPSPWILAVGALFGLELGLLAGAIGLIEQRVARAWAASLAVLFVAVFAVHVFGVQVEYGASVVTLRSFSGALRRVWQHLGNAVSLDPRTVYEVSMLTTLAVPFAPVTLGRKLALALPLQVVAAAAPSAATVLAVVHLGDWPWGAHDRGLFLTAVTITSVVLPIAGRLADTIEARLER